MGSISRELAFVLGDVHQREEFIAVYVVRAFIFNVGDSNYHVGIACGIGRENVFQESIFHRETTEPQEKGIVSRQNRRKSSPADMEFRILSYVPPHREMVFVVVLFYQITNRAVADMAVIGVSIFQRADDCN